MPQEVACPRVESFKLSALGYLNPFCSRLPCFEFWHDTSLLLRYNGDDKMTPFGKWTFFNLANI